MDMDLALVNRALMNINMEPLEESIREDKGKEWRTARDYYLGAMLEALARADWTSAKRRRELSPAQKPARRHPGFAYVYCLPLDCAKPVELDGHEYFEVEAGLLFTSARPARLLYVSNGRRFVCTAVSGGSARRQPSPDYIWGGDAKRGRRLEWGDGIVSGGSAVTPPPPELGGDFPGYRELRLEPSFMLYWEYLLTSKYARRLTGQPGLADEWLQKAVAVGRASEAASAAAAAGARKAPPTWQEKLGLCGETGASPRGGRGPGC